LALVQLAEEASAPQIAKVLILTPHAIRRLGHRYERDGLDGALYEKQRPGAVEVLDTNQKQRIIAMTCSDPPEGCALWTVRLVAEEAVKRKFVPHVGRETIRILLLHHNVKPWWEKCRALTRSVNSAPTEHLGESTGCYSIARVTVFDSTPPMRSDTGTVAPAGALSGIRTLIW
jgi:transposase